MQIDADHRIALVITGSTGWFAALAENDPVLAPGFQSQKQARGEGPSSALRYHHGPAVVAVWEAGVCANAMASVDSPADDVDADDADATADADAAIAAAAVAAVADVPQLHQE